MMNITAMKRAGLLLALTLPTACDDAGRADEPPAVGIVFTTAAPDDAGTDSTSGSSTGDGSSTFPPGYLGSTGAESTGDADASTGGTGTGDDASTGGSSSTGDGSSGGDSTGEDPPPPSVCGDGVCDEAEAAVGCYAPGWCLNDCKAEPECVTECPCAPEANAGKNVCYLPPGTCDAVKPGGLCDPDGDHDFADGDWTLGWQLWSAKCG